MSAPAVPQPVADTGAPPVRPAGTPVTAAYARLTEVLPFLAVTELGPADPLPAGPGWVAAADLAAGGPALDDFLAWDAEQVRRTYGEDARPDVVASFGLHRYAWSACLLVTLPWFLLRRVPRVPLDAVALHRNADGSRMRLAVHGGAFACLPDDPAAGLPGARVVGGEEALRAEVRAAVAEHLEPVLAAFGPRMRRGPRALWGMATDEIVEGLWYLGDLLGEEERAMAETGQLLPGSGPATAPYAGGAAFRTLTGPAGQSLATRDRASCCMYYTLRPEDTCVTCPRTCDTERVARLVASS
ncbi:(2Fe-2S)-binding protein [Streptomyces sp. CMB-StM0423]|uniref:(2Fe-2S)-binding protein n=1 Tax=Streptomyces sp. CMB-StM0423 TaxID=2059884 RepID=UPI000C703E1C|nr:(2Fe-2S)-binding protein [Streptomyces sp. CMB-StM0423]AUH39790.1 iron-sulfur protein [Streptomyces sp. CMB-StM0423]